MSPSRLSALTTEEIKVAGDAAAVSTGAATFFFVGDILSTLAALASLIYLVIRIFETKSVQRWLKKWRADQ